MLVYREFSSLKFPEEETCMLAQPERARAIPLPLLADELDGKFSLYDSSLWRKSEQQQIVCRSFLLKFLLVC